MANAMLAQNNDSGMLNNTVYNVEDGQRRILHHLFPAIIILCLCELLGIIGNIAVFVFYRTKTKQTSTVLLIEIMSIQDTLVCLVNTHNVYEMVMNITYKHHLLCKVAHSLGVWMVGSSAFTILSIAVDRYRKICKPLRRQTSVKLIKYSTSTIILFFACLGSRKMITYDTDIVQVTIDGLSFEGTFCQLRTKSGLVLVVKLFNSAEYILILSVLLSIVICYSLVVKKLFRKRLSQSMKYFSFRRNANNTSAFETNLGENASTWPLPGMRTDQHTLKVRKTPNEMDPPENAHSRPVHERIVKSPPPEERKDLNETLVTYSTNDDDDLSEPELSTGVGIDYNKRNHSADSSLPLRQRIRKLRRKKLKLRKKEVRITLMMFTLSMVYVLCFVPYIIVKGKDLKYKVGHELELNVYQQLALRMPYLNSVINPFVYLICNKTFRKFLSIRCCFHMF